MDDKLWRSMDMGISWENIAGAGVTWKKRVGHCMLVIQDVIYIMGGSGINISFIYVFIIINAV